MKLSETVEWVLHSCVALAFLPQNARIPARALAEFHGLKPAYLAKAMQKLAEAGLVKSVEGRSGGFALARPAAKISILEIVDAVEPDQGFFRCTEIRRRGPCAARSAAYVKPCIIARTMHRADAAWRAVLAQISLSQLATDAQADIPEGVADRTAVWIKRSGALRLAAIART
jgi:Rrf2 family protein